MIGCISLVFYQSLTSCLLFIVVICHFELQDKNAPKRGMSAFMFFSNTNRNEVKAENPELGIGGIAKVLGERYVCNGIQLQIHESGCCVTRSCKKSDLL